MSPLFLDFSASLGAVAAGYEHSIVLREDGSVWTTGYNNHGQLGDGTNTNKNLFEIVQSSGQWGTMRVAIPMHRPTLG